MYLLNEKLKNDKTYCFLTDVYNNQANVSLAIKPLAGDCS